MVVAICQFLVLFVDVMDYV